MLIVLIILLILLDVALRLSILGVELAYRVGKRANALRTKATKSAIKVVGNKPARYALGSANKGIDIGFSAVLGAGSEVAVKSLKVGLRFCRWVVRILKDLLTVAEGVLIVVDIIVFIILVCVAYFYLFYLGGQG